MVQVRPVLRIPRPAGFPQNHSIPEIVGRLRTGHDVIVTDADVSIWVPERTHGSARFAVVGLGIAKAARRYPRLRLQLTGSDLLFGIPPLESIQFPNPENFRFEGQFGATLNRQSVQTWQDATSGVAITCSYEGNFSLTNRYRHQLAFAPVVEFEGEPGTIDEWMDLWVRPLLGLTALATRAPQQLGWVVVRAAPDDPADQAGEACSVVFGSGISQEPYQAEEPPVRTDPDWRPLLTLRTLPVGLPAVLRAWRDLEASDNPFLELYRSVLFQPAILDHAGPREAAVRTPLDPMWTAFALRPRDDDDRPPGRTPSERESPACASAQWLRRQPPSIGRSPRTVLAERRRLRSSVPYRYGRAPTSGSRSRQPNARPPMFAECRFGRKQHLLDLGFRHKA
jgi:hypothetical protein